MSFKIIKKGSNNFWHLFNNNSKEVNLSEFEVVLDSVGQTFSIAMRNGANVPNNVVSIFDIIVIDETDGGVEETFTSVEDLRVRLIALNYTPYILSNGFVPEAPIDGLTYGRKDAEWVEVSALAGDLQQVTDNGNVTTNDITAGSFQSLSNINIPAVRFNDAADLEVSLGGLDADPSITTPRSWVLPDASGTIALLSDLPTTTADIAESTDKNYVTDAELVVIGNTSGTNTGDQDTSGLMPYAISPPASTISFEKPYIYASFTSPTNDNPVLDILTGARRGVVQKIYHNATTEPTYPAGWVKLFGTYTNSATNIIYCEWSESSRVEYWIVEA